MADLIVLFLHAIASVCRVVRPGGIRSVVAESVLLKHQLLILNRSRLRAPNLRTWDRAVVGLCSVFVKPVRFSPSRHRAQALHHPKLPSGPGPAKVSAAVFTEAENQARTKGTRCGDHSRRCRDETAQSDLGLLAYRQSNQFGLRHMY
jgi:hypothetical protein